jgi:hypothetical protein
LTYLKISSQRKAVIDQVAHKLKKKKSSLSKSEEMITQKEAASILAEFLPDPIRDALLNL